MQIYSLTFLNYIASFYQTSSEKIEQQNLFDAPVLPHSNNQNIVDGFVGKQSGTNNVIADFGHWAIEPVVGTNRHGIAHASMLQHKQQIYTESSLEEKNEAQSEVGDLSNQNSRNIGMNVSNDGQSFLLFDGKNTINIKSDSPIHLGKGNVLYGTVLNVSNVVVADNDFQLWDGKNVLLNRGNLHQECLWYYILFALIFNSVNFNFDFNEFM